MAELFDRKARVTISSPKASDYFGEGSNALVITDLRVRFSIEKDLGKDPNKCELKIDNLSETTRAKIQAKPLQIRLECGYGDDYKLIYIGDLIYGSSRREGPNWVTTLQLGSGIRAYRHARVNRSFVEGTTYKQVLRELALSMNATLPTEANDSAFDKQFVSGVSIHGKASAWMDKILEPLNMTWSVQDNRLQILKKGEARASKAFPISQKNGMIGTPEFGSPTRKQKPTLAVQMLLYPELYPGGRVKMESEGIDGVFRVNKLQHVGDTHGAEWFTTIEGRPL